MGSLHTAVLKFFECGVMQLKLHALPCLKHLLFLSFTQDAKGVLSRYLFIALPVRWRDLISWLTNFFAVILNEFAITKGSQR